MPLAGVVGRGVGGGHGVAPREGNRDGRIRAGDADDGFLGKVSAHLVVKPIIQALSGVFACCHQQVGQQVFVRKDIAFAEAF